MKNTNTPKQPDLKAISRELGRHLRRPEWLGEAYGVRSEALDHLSQAIISEIEWVIAAVEPSTLLEQHDTSLKSVAAFIRDIGHNSSTGEERDALRAAGRALEVAINLRQARMLIERAEAEGWEMAA